MIKLSQFSFIKWGKEKFSDVECNTDDPPMVFKAQLFALSGVQPDRQKVMLKGAVVKVFVNENWDNLIMTSSMNY
jgi:ubiquitin carboxyl-terminal hydrolase 14